MLAKYKAKGILGQLHWPRWWYRYSRAVSKGHAGQTLDIKRNVNIGYEDFGGIGEAFFTEFVIQYAKNFAVLD